MSVEYTTFGDSQITVNPAAPENIQFQTLNVDPNEPANLAYNLRLLEIPRLGSISTEP